MGHVADSSTALKSGNYPLHLPSVTFILDSDHNVVRLVDKVHRAHKDSLYLSLLEEFLQGVTKALGVLYKLPFPVFQSLLPIWRWNVGGDVINSIQQLLDRAGNLFDGV